MEGTEGETGGECALKVAADTNRLGGITQRRFNAAWREMLGSRLHVVPQVAGELVLHRLKLDQLPEEVKRLEASLAAGERRTRGAIMADLSDLWWARELLRVDSPYELTRMTEDEHEQVREICLNIDPSCFPSTPPEDVWRNSDTIIVAQALVTGQNLLVTGDFRTINHHRVNDWADKHGPQHGVNEPGEVFVQDLLMTELYPDREGALDLCAFVLGASWPDDPAADFNEVDAALRGMLGAMEGARLGDTKQVVEDAWRGCNHPEELMDWVRGNLPNRMRASEKRHPALSGWRVPQMPSKAQRNDSQSCRP